MIKNALKILTFTAIATLASCSGEPNKNTVATGEQVTIVHKLGTTDVPQNPRRVVVFDMGALETLTELGIKPVAIPKDIVPDHLIQFKTDDTIENAGSVKEPNFEKVSAVNPDLIIISARLETFYDELSKIAPTIYLGIDTQDYMTSFEKNSMEIGKIFNKEAEVKEQLDALKNEIKTEQEKYVGNDKKGLIVLFNNGKFSAYGKGSRFGFIHDVLGISAVDDQLEVATHGQPVSSEFIADENPDYLFVVDRAAVVNGQPAARDNIENALIQKTNAYKNGKIIYLNPQIWYLSGGGITSTHAMINEIKEALK